MDADGLSEEGPSFLGSTYLPRIACDIDELPQVMFIPGAEKMTSADVGEISGLLSSSLGLSSSNAESGIAFGNGAIPEESVQDTFSGSLRSQSKQGSSSRMGSSNDQSAGFERGKSINQEGRKESRYDQISHLGALPKPHQYGSSTVNIQHLAHNNAKMAKTASELPADPGFGHQSGSHSSSLRLVFDARPSAVTSSGYSHTAGQGSSLGGTTEAAKSSHLQALASRPGPTNTMSRLESHLPGAAPSMSLSSGYGLMRNASAFGDGEQQLAERQAHDHEMYPRSMNELLQQPFAQLSQRDKATVHAHLHQVIEQKTEEYRILLNFLK